MKTKKNKKSYNFTEKQRRKDKSVKCSSGWCNAPKEFVRSYNRRFKTKCKQIMHYNYINSAEKEYPIPGRHTAVWEYW